MSRPSLSLVIPAYNESSRIEKTLAEAWAFLNDQPYPGELILVDDGSNDGTAAIGQRFAAEQPGPIIKTIPHGGKAAALRAGMEMATGDFIAFSDADLSTPLSFLNDLRGSIEAGNDVAIGSREGAGSRRIGEPLHRHVMGRGFNFMVRTLMLPGIQDTQCGFKLFTRQAVQVILGRSHLYATEGEQIQGPRVTAYDVELLVIARRQGLKIGVIPIVWTYGVGSKVNPVRDTLRNLQDVAEIKINDMRGRYA